MDIQEAFTGSFSMYRVFVEDHCCLYAMETIDSEINMSDDTHDFYSKLLSLRYNVSHDKVWIISSDENERFKK